MQAEKNIDQFKLIDMQNADNLTPMNSFEGEDTSMRLEET